MLKLILIKKCVHLHLQSFFVHDYWKDVMVRWILLDFWYLCFLDPTKIGMKGVFGFSPSSVAHRTKILSSQNSGQDIGCLWFGHFGKKSKLELAKGQGHAKILATIQTRSKNLVGWIFCFLTRIKHHSIRIRVQIKSCADHALIH